MQPGQQHGRRIPSFSSETTLLTCSFLVSGIFTEMVQQIHSFLASGVMSSHAASAFRSAIKAFRKSTGNVCATPLEILFVICVITILHLIVANLDSILIKGRHKGIILLQYENTSENRGLTLLIHIFMKIAFIHNEKKIGTGAHYINDLMANKLKERGIVTKNFYPSTALMD